MGKSDIPSNNNKRVSLGEKRPKKELRSVLRGVDSLEKVKKKKIKKGFNRKKKIFSFRTTRRTSNPSYNLIPASKIKPNKIIATKRLATGNTYILKTSKFIPNKNSFEMFLPKKNIKEILKTERKYHSNILSKKIINIIQNKPKKTNKPKNSLEEKIKKNFKPKPWQSLSKSDYDDWDLIN